MREPRLVDVKSFCSQIRDDVTLSLLVASPPRRIGRMVSGVPVSCSVSVGCTMGPYCLLRATLVGTGRKRR